MRRNRSIHSQLLLLVLFELTDDRLLVFNSRFGSYLYQLYQGWAGNAKNRPLCLLRCPCPRPRVFPFLLPLDVFHVYDRWLLLTLYFSVSVAMLRLCLGPDRIPRLYTVRSFIPIEVTLILPCIQEVEMIAQWRYEP